METGRQTTPLTEAIYQLEEHHYNSSSDQRRIAYNQAIKVLKKLLPMEERHLIKAFDEGTDDQIRASKGQVCSYMDGKDYVEVTYKDYTPESTE